MKRYQLIKPDGRKGQIYKGEPGLIYVQSVCAQNDGWTWRELNDAPIVELGINDAVHKSKADT